MKENVAINLYAKKTFAFPVCYSSFLFQIFFVSGPGFFCWSTVTLSSGYNEMEAHNFRCLQHRCYVFHNCFSKPFMTCSGKTSQPTIEMEEKLTEHNVEESSTESSSSDNDDDVIVASEKARPAHIGVEIPDEDQLYGSC